jgi:hypothetical protein
MELQTTQPAKRPYEKPEIVDHGDLTELTAAHITPIPGMNTMASVLSSPIVPNFKP